jgi:hypothetical protein
MNRQTQDEQYTAEQWAQRRKEWESSHSLDTCPCNAHPMHKCDCKGSCSCHWKEKAKMNYPPETKTLVDTANRLLSIWQEQEQASDRAWDEQKVAYERFVALIQSENSTADEIRAAHQTSLKLAARARNLPSHYDTKREWAGVRAQAQRAIAEDAGLLRSEEEKSYDAEVVTREEKEPPRSP